jgi:cellobiose epimerase
MPEFLLKSQFARLLAFIAVLLALGAAGCDARRDDSARIDVQWHRSSMVDGLLARWLAVAPAEGGFLQTSFDRSWKAKAEQPGYLTEHARLVYSLINGYEVTRDKRYLEAANRSADFLLTRFRDPVHGGFFQRVAADGKVLYDTKNTYGHAFALLALSHMARVTGEARYRTAALAAWRDIDLWLRDGKGGFFRELPRDFSKTGAVANENKTQNPLMHLFEALLALHDATQDPVAMKGAKSLGEFVVYRLMQGRPEDGASIPEWYDSDWKPLATKELGGYTDLGHQFEWSHLLWEAEARGLTGIYSLSAERLLNFAVKNGYDEVNGGAYWRQYPDGAVDREKFWWQQTEAMRAFLMSATRGGKQDMWRRYEQTLKLVQDQFIDKSNGGWYDKACARGGCRGDQVEPYHMTAMHLFAIELAAKQKK